MTELMTSEIFRDITAMAGWWLPAICCREDHIIFISVATNIHNHLQPPSPIAAFLNLCVYKNELLLNICLRTWFETTGALGECFWSHRGHQLIYPSHFCPHDPSCRHLSYSQIFIPCPPRLQIHHVNVKGFWCQNEFKILRILTFKEEIVLPVQLQ